MAYTFARVGAIITMKGEDYFRQGKRWWFRLHEKGGKRYEVPATTKQRRNLQILADSTDLRKLIAHLKSCRSLTGGLGGRVRRILVS
jgi:integrase